MGIYEQNINLTNRQSIAYLSIDRPPANAYEINLLCALTVAIEEINQDAEINVAVVQSASPKFFSAGADIKVYAASSLAENKKMVSAARQVAQLIAKSPKIFIAALQGHALGGGLELAMACDFRIAVEGKYQLGLPEIKLGLMPGNGGVARLMHLVGASRALELLMTGNSIDVHRAHQIGLIHHVFPRHQFEEQLHDFAHNLSSGPQQAIAAVKTFCRRSQGLNIEEALILEKELADKLDHTPDAREGLRAFIEKRIPNFSNKN